MSSPQPIPAPKRAATKKPADPLGKAKKIKDALDKGAEIVGDLEGESWKELYEKWTKPAGQVLTWYDRYDRLKKLLDEETRKSQTSKEMRSLAVTAIAKALNVSKWRINTHPYMVYHSVHFELLDMALDAVSSLEVAQQHLERARQQTTEIESEARRVAIDYAVPDSKNYQEFVTATNQLFLAFNSLQMCVEYGYPEAATRTAAQQFKLAHWNCQSWLQELMGYYAMLRVDQAVVEKSMQLYRDKLKTMEKKNNLQLIFSKSEQNRDMYDRIKQKSPEQQVGSAVSAVDSCVQAWMKNCDRMLGLVARD